MANVCSAHRPYEATFKKQSRWRLPDAITAIRGYLPHDDESAGWAAVIEWLNSKCPPPPGFDLSRVPRKG